jgi:hypothetical protein
MQYDLDRQGIHADIFGSIRDILLSYPQIVELKNPMQTSYHDEYGVVVMIRGRSDGLVVSFGKGVKLQEKYPVLQGNGKVVRHLLLRSLGDVNEALLREMIEESLMVNLETYEIKRLKSSL